MDAGTRVTWIGALLNIALVLGKVGVGLWSGSAAVVADGVHSLSDLLSDAVVLVGLRWGSAEADEAHPFGHRRIETMAAAWVGLLLILTAFYLIYEAVMSLRAGAWSQPGGWALAVTALSVLTKEWLYRWTAAVGREIGSAAVIANAWHHRSDALSSVGVFVGVGAAWLHPSLGWADGAAAAVVGLLVLQVGFTIVRDAAREMVDRAPDAEVVSALAARIDGFPGVLGHHALKVRLMGGKLLIQVHVVVDSDLTVGEGHAIADGLEANLLAMSDVMDVLVHIDPDDLDRSDEVARAATGEAP